MQDGQLSVRQALDAYREHQTEKGNRPVKDSYSAHRPTNLAMRAVRNLPTNRRRRVHTPDDQHCQQ